MSFTVYKFILFSLSGYWRKFDSQFPPIYQWENFNEILIIKANIMVNIFIVEKLISNRT